MRYIAFALCFSVSLLSVLFLTPPNPAPVLYPDYQSGVSINEYRVLDSDQLPVTCAGGDRVAIKASPDSYRDYFHFHYYACIGNNSWQRFYNQRAAPRIVSDMY